MRLPFLFSNRLKTTGWFLMSFGAVLGISVLIYNVQFDFLKGRIWSFYATIGEEEHFFGFGHLGNYTSTLVSILFLFGAVLVAFSKMKVEDEFVFNLRTDALIWSMYVNYGILFICLIGFYDFDFLYVLILNIYTPLIIFILRFHYTYYLAQRSKES